MLAKLSQQVDVTWLLSGKLSDTSPMHHVTLDHSPFCVGRRNGLGLTLPCPTVSGRHAEFLVQERQLTLRDLESTNGTFVNGVRVHDVCEVADGDLVQFADVVFRVCQRSMVEEVHTICDDVWDRALALIQFDKLISQRAVLPFFQPIVTMEARQTIGFEVLGRSRLYGLTDPKSMFRAASLLDLEDELSRILRSEGVRVGDVLPSESSLFVNTHPDELSELAELTASLGELRQQHPERPITLEIHEAAVTSPAMMRQLKRALADLEIGLAYDDFGAGQPRLAELVEVPPDVLKFDLKLIRNIDEASTEQRQLLQTLVQMVRSLGVMPLAEGVETAAADEACREIGFELGQGFFYGRPAVVSQFLEAAGES